MNIGLKLIQDIDKELKTDKTSFTLKGVKDLDKNDMNRLRSYADMYEKTDGCCPQGFLPMNDRIKEVLTIYGLLW